jgi:hypothetical protein
MIEDQMDISSKSNNSNICISSQPDSKTRVLSFNHKQLEYDRRVRGKGKHHGQKKLFISELEFLTKYLVRSNMVVVYAGSAKGMHIELLARCFPRNDFYLFDPAPTYVGDFSNIYINKMIFTHQTAAEFADKEVLFINDIRTYDDKETREVLIHQYKKMEIGLSIKWITVMKPIASMMKFTLPFEGIVEHFDGSIYYPVYGRSNTTESRLVVEGVPRLTTYNCVDYERIMCNFNINVRPDYDYDVANDIIESYCTSELAKISFDKLSSYFHKSNWNASRGFSEPLILRSSIYTVKLQDKRDKAKAGIKRFDSDTVVDNLVTPAKWTFKHYNMSFENEAEVSYDVLPTKVLFRKFTVLDYDQIVSPFRDNTGFKNKLELNLKFMDDGFHADGHRFNAFGSILPRQVKINKMKTKGYSFVTQIEIRDDMLAQVCRPFSVFRTEIMYQGRYKSFTYDINNYMSTKLKTMALVRPCMFFKMTNQSNFNNFNFPETHFRFLDDMICGHLLFNWSHEIIQISTRLIHGFNGDFTSTTYNISEPLSDHDLEYLKSQDFLEDLKLVSKVDVSSILPGSDDITLENLCSVHDQLTSQEFTSTAQHVLYQYIVYQKFYLLCQSECNEPLRFVQEFRMATYTEDHYSSTGLMGIRYTDTGNHSAIFRPGKLLRAWFYILDLLKTRQHFLMYRALIKKIDVVVHAYTFWRTSENFGQINYISHLDELSKLVIENVIPDWISMFIEQSYLTATSRNIDKTLSFNNVHRIKKNVYRVGRYSPLFEFNSLMPSLMSCSLVRDRSYQELIVSCVRASYYVVMDLYILPNYHTGHNIKDVRFYDNNDGRPGSLSYCSMSQALNSFNRQVVLSVTRDLTYRYMSWYVERNTVLKIIYCPIEVIASRVSKRNEVTTSYYGMTRKIDGIVYRRKTFLKFMRDHYQFKLT